MNKCLQNWQFAQDRNRLLRSWKNNTHQSFQVPAEALTQIIRMQGYDILWVDYLPSSTLACCHFDHQVVWLARGFASRLRHPQSVLEVLLSSLAHELGHIRLHAWLARQGAREEHWEDEAFRYAQIFLVPLSQLLQNPDCQTLLQVGWKSQARLWALVLSLAKFFRVSGAFMANTLELYGLIDFCRKRRRITPRVSARAC